jgi:hypothetical protein
MKISRKSLEEKGWMFQFLVDRASADDAEKVYNLLGFEVLRLPVGKPPLRKTISYSFEKPSGLCEVVYVRPKKQTANGGKDWT